MKKILFSISILILAFSLQIQAEDLKGKIMGPAEVFEVEDDFETVRDNLVFNIESRGLVISYISHAQDMLARTADVLEDAEKVYSDAEIMLFCKSGLSHRLAADNPHNIVICPYPIAVYALEGKPGKTYLSIPVYADRAIYNELRAYLVEIIASTMDGF